MSDVPVPLNVVRIYLPNGYTVVRGREVRIEVDRRVMPGQPVKVSLGDRSREILHVAGPMWSTGFGRTVAGVTFEEDRETLTTMPCAICGKTGTVRYAIANTEWACIMCHYWLVNSGMSYKGSHGGTDYFAVRSLGPLLPIGPKAGKAWVPPFPDSWGPFQVPELSNWW